MKKKQKWFDSAIVREDESEATEKSKHFILNDGTRKVVFTPTNVNYFDESTNAWKPIDATLKSEDNGYHAQLGIYTAKFSKSIENETVELSNGSSSISWEYLGTNHNMFANHSGDAKVVKRKSKLSVSSCIQDHLKLATTSRVIYQGAEGNVDLDYRIEGNGIKENIVVKDKSDGYRYYFLLRVSGFNIKKSKSGKIIEFYRNNAEETDVPEFIMPAPFMHDSNGNKSDEVNYFLEDIGNECYIFSVKANPEWINANERVFPVYVDPQLLTVSSSNITVSHDLYQWHDCDCCSDCSCYDSYWMHIGNRYYSYIYLQNNGYEKITAKLRIKKSGIDLTRNKVISAKLIFQVPAGDTYTSSTRIRIGNKNYSHKNERTLTADIIDLYNSTPGDFNVDLSIDSKYPSRKFNLPILQIEYQPINNDVVCKTLSLEPDANAEFDVLSGNATIVFNDISDPTLGVSVSHVYKPNDAIVEYGQNFRLNLDEKLIKTSNSSTGAQYTYTDSNGNVHTFNEHFYQIGANGTKVYITSEISSIIADADGRLWLNGTEVFRELTTNRGLRASARLEGVVNNAEWVEQRIDEEKQAEEQEKTYKNTLCNFVSVNKTTCKTTNTLTEDKLSVPDFVESFLTEVGCASHLLLSKEEALTYKSLVTQKSALIASATSLETSQKSINISALDLKTQYKIISNDIDEKQKKIDELTNEINNSEDEAKQDELLAEQAILIERRKNIEMQINMFSIEGNYLLKIADVESGSLTWQLSDVLNQKSLINKQIADLTAQISLYASKKSQYTEQLKSYYKEYLNLKNQRDKLKMQVPVAYLISDSMVKGFNSKGELVIIQDKYGKYVVVEREKYNATGKTRIGTVYDQNGKTMSFSYNGSYKLSEICNSLGERVTFGYDSSGYLTTIKHDNHPMLTLSYKTSAGIQRIFKIESTNKTFAELSYNSLGMLTGITRNSTVNSIAHDNVFNGSTVALSTMGVKYTSTETQLTYDGTKQEIYKINQRAEQVTAHYELLNELVTNAERYSYSNYLLTKTERADKSCLNRHSYADFAAQMQIETVEDVTYNSFKNPTLAVTSKYAVPRTDCDSPIEQTTVEYTYNDDHKLIEKKIKHSYLDCCVAFDTTVLVEKYYYDNAGELVRKESYVEGEELKTGINIEEHVFNDKGLEIKSFTYNSLDPSSKVYTENEVDENGKVLSAFNESGEHKTTFDYERDGVTVKTERLPNGSKFSYGRDKYGTVTAITHSTENGEENSTTQTRTLDVVTEVKSGNNTVQYIYDNKRRVKSVSLNGVDNYVTYTYSGEHTNAETVTATLAKGTDCELVSKSIKNAHGNVTESSVGNRKVTYHYNNDQLPDVITEKIGNSTTSTTEIGYNGKGSVESVKVNAVETERYSYDDKNVLTSKTVDGTTYTFTYKATADQSLDSITVDGNTVSPITDALGRNTGKVIETAIANVAEEKISYVKFGDHATSLPSNVRFASNGVFNESIQYKYDSMGNIIEVFENGRSACRYEYDALGRLTREDNVPFGKTTTWTYDNNGNILARYEYAITTKPTNELHLLECTSFNYAYDDNSDQLVSYDGEVLEYDLIGNPKKYKGIDADWENGRQLTAYDGNTFTYDARGRRLTKNDISFTYDSNGNLIKQSDGLEFFYDHSGVFAVKHNNATYFYRKDAQANVVALLDNNGNPVVKYNYDAWGKCHTTVVDATANTIAELNPFRYRSYYYDTETGFYFLKTRYYDPEVGRFITIDDLSYLDPESINGLNLYAYCLNNPVKYSDPNGTFIISGTAILIAALISAGIGAGIAAGSTVYRDYMDDGRLFNGSITLWSYLGNILGGAIAGFGIGVCVALGAGFGASLLGFGVATTGLTLSGGSALAIASIAAFTTGGLGYATRVALSDQETFEWSDMFIEAGANLLSGITSFAGGMIGGMLGAKIPGAKFDWGDFIAYQISQVWFGVYPFKILLSYIKSQLKEIW